MNLVIRPLAAHERAEWEKRWLAYLAFYKTDLPAAVTENTWARLNDPAEPVFALAAFIDGRMAGIVQYLFHRTNWSISDTCYLQDLFVDEEDRGRGVGRALIEAVAEKAREAGASRLYWLTHETNDAARTLYDAVAERSGFIQYRKGL